MPTVDGVILGVDPTTESDTFLLKFIDTVLRKYQENYLLYDPNSNRQKLEESKEREKQRFIGEFDKIKDEDERRIAVVKKRLGLGKWSIGGTKLVYKYDPKQWVKNRDETSLTYGIEGDTMGTGEIGLYEMGENDQPEGEGYDMETQGGEYDDN
jgi:hypothetical protein